MGVYESISESVNTKKYLYLAGVTDLEVVVKKMQLKGSCCRAAAAKSLVVSNSWGTGYVFVSDQEDRISF